MIAATFTQGAGFAVREVARPEIRDGELLVRVGAASICGTDLRIVRHGQRKLSDGESVVLGHEFAGTIEAVGGGVTGYAPGMRVGIAPNIGCGRCALCARALPNMCPEYTAFGINIDGAHTKYVRIPAACVAQGSVVPLPDDLSFAHAALVEPLSCAVSGHRSVRVTLGETLVLFGAGPIGLMHILLARLRGAGRIIVADPVAARREQACTMGADVTLDPVTEDVVDRLMTLTDGLGADAVITACSVHAAQEQAVAMLAPYGRVCFFGGLPKDRPTITLDSNAVHYKNLVITGVTGGAPVDFRAAMSLVASGRIDLEPLLSHRFSLSQLQEAYDTAGSGEAMRVVITPE